MDTSTDKDPHLITPVLEGGAPASRAQATMIMLHGRGADAAGMIDLSQQLAQPHIRYLAPQAAGRTWYPYPFTEPIEKNQPHLSSALNKIGALIRQSVDEGTPQSKIFLFGFSQGACLALHYAAAHPVRLGGIIALSGALIGAQLNKGDYRGDLQQTPVFMGVGELETHFSLDRFHQTSEIMSHLNGNVMAHVYPNKGHQITGEEVTYIRGLLSSF